MASTEACPNPRPWRWGFRSVVVGRWLGLMILGQMLGPVGGSVVSLDRAAAAAEKQMERDLGQLVKAVEYMDVDTKRCTIFSSYFDYAVQGALGVLALGSVWVKFEYVDSKAHRNFKVWAMDTFKQAGGGCLAHLMNIGMAKALYDTMPTRTADECDFYLVNLILDTLLGLGILYGLLYVYEYVMRPCLPCGIRPTGDYGNPVQYSTWMFQVLVWCFFVVIMKVFIFMIEVVALVYIDWISHWILGPLDIWPRVKLVVVMIVAPLIMTATGFWIVDVWISHTPDKTNLETQTHPHSRHKTSRGTRGGHGLDGVSNNENLEASEWLLVGEEADHEANCNDCEVDSSVGADERTLNHRDAP
ncbi:hypothetical protein AAMO2058_000942300 [Amorphochlora amoebiformis]